VSRVGGSAGSRSVRQVLRHDLRSPLAVIVGRCDMLASGALGALDEHQLRSVEAILRNAERIERELDHLADHLPAQALTLEIPAPGTGE
jgi:signal transduction histidine kinase